jgi:hypothetical protein
MKTTILSIALITASTFSFAASHSGGDDTNKLTTGNTLSGNLVLANFKGVFNNQQVVDLSWNTMMESDVDHFEIQRSGDGMTFQELTSVPSKMKITTNDYQLQYNFTDTHPFPGTSFYRIKVISKNGSSNQSPVVQISNMNPVDGTKIYPTLIQNNMVFVESDKTLRSVRMEFFDLSGKKISETDLESLNGRQSVLVSKSGMLPTGTYLARLTANGQRVKNQLVIVQSH